MKKRCIVIIMLITILNVLLAVYVQNKYVLAALSLSVTAIGITALYYWLLEPVITMKKQLKQVEEENRALEAMRKEFVANVTHELKTPLTSISGFIETLQNSAVEDPEVKAKFIDIIAIETSRLKRLIDDILVLSDIESEKEQKAQRIDVKESVYSIVEFIEPIAKERNIQLITDIGNGLLVRGSADRFRQMLVNIIENAIKYSDDGGRVWIDGYLKNGHATIEIRDEGIGISKENLDRLFERFYRVDKSRSRKVGGTGLGLSIVKHIAFLFGAEIKVESELKKGTVFYISF